LQVKLDKELQSLPPPSNNETELGWITEQILGFTKMLEAVCQLASAFS
jgi:hypothetical protein